MPILWTPDELQHATNGTWLRQPSTKIRGISIDTRTLIPGDLFVALQGERFDGHHFVEDAFQRGASAALTNKEWRGKGVVLQVSNTLTGLEMIADAARQRFKGKMFAITGSVGKTTTKNILCHMLTRYGSVHAAQASHNNHWGVPLTLARLPQEADFCICEVGMNHSGEILPLARRIRPNIGIITFIAPAHIGHLGSIRAIIDEKASLLKELEKDCIGITQEKNPGLDIIQKTLMQAGHQLLLTGKTKSCFVRQIEVHMTQTGSQCVIAVNRVHYPVQLHVAGQHIIDNMLQAIAGVASINLDVSLASVAMTDFKTTAGRGTIVPLLNGRARLIDESYNASSTISMTSALDVLALYKQGRRIAVLGDILEQGHYSVEQHLSLRPIILHSSDLVFCCGTAMQELYRSLPDYLQGGWQSNAETLAPLVAKAIQAGDTVLVKGSHGMNMHIVVEYLSRTPVEK